jgi:hypothetical protein
LELNHRFSVRLATSKVLTGRIPGLVITSPELAGVERTSEIRILAAIFVPEPMDALAGHLEISSAP